MPTHGRATATRSRRIAPTITPATLWDLDGSTNAVAPVSIRQREPQQAAGGLCATKSRFLVLASSSAGNCSLLIHGEGRNTRLTLIDAGLSPMRTRRALATLGLTLDRIDEIVFTHLDADHCHKGWIKALPEHAHFRVHRRHRGRAGRIGLLARRTLVFENDPFRLARGITVRPTLLAHDDLGVAAFRFEWNGEHTAALGYATDLGRVTTDLVRMLEGVDVLAIESNYCLHLQHASDRPEFLKQRIMNGAGHLSNEECRAAVAAIAPQRELVLLHLSRQCNTPERAAHFHAAAPYRLTLAHHELPTPQIPMAR